MATAPGRPRATRRKNDTFSGLGAPSPPKKVQVARALAHAPRLAVAAGAGIGPTQVAALRERLTDDGKLTVVAGDAERALLQQALRQQQGAAFDERLQCELGKEVPANAVLQVSGGACDQGAAADHAGKATGASVAGGEVAAAVGRLIVKVQPKDAVVEVTGPKNFRTTGRDGWESATLAAGAGRHRGTCGLSRDEGPAGAG